MRPVNCARSAESIIVPFDVIPQVFTRREVRLLRGLAAGQLPVDTRSCVIPTNFGGATFGGKGFLERDSEIPYSVRLEDDR